MIMPLIMSASLQIIFIKFTIGSLGITVQVDSTGPRIRLSGTARCWLHHKHVQEDYKNKAHTLGWALFFFTVMSA